jgi:RNA methyltransferase, rsmE family
MPHFFISTSDVNQDIITVSDKENFHHIARVLRSKVGETLLLVDENRTQYKVVIQNIDSKSITTKVVETLKANHCLDLSLYLVQSVLKTDAQNFVMQKATELGIKKIIPVITDNSVIKPSVADSKIDKWQKIANEAVKQCERVDFPMVEQRTTIEQVLDNQDFDIKIACVERTHTMTLKECLRNIKIKSDTKIAVIIGPEGGFSAREIELLNRHENVYKVSLGKMILRAETAVISALSNVIYELEND